MAVEKMKIVYLSGNYKKLNNLTNTLLFCDYFQPETASDVLDASSGFTPINEENPYALMYNRLKTIVEENGFITKISKKNKKLIKEEEAEIIVSGIENELKILQDEVLDLKKSYEESEYIIDQIDEFSSFNVDLGKINNLNFVKAHFGRLPKASTEKLQYYVDNPYLHFYVASSNEEYDWGVYFSPQENSSKIDRIFASLFFEKINMPSNSGTPESIIKSLNKTLEEIKQKLNDTQAKLNNFILEHKKEIIALYNQFKKQNDAFLLRNYAALYDKSFLLIGWIPEQTVAEFSQLIDSSVSGVIVNYDNAENITNLKPPTKLKNSYFFRPFQYFVEIYGAPNYKELDPTVFVAITYTLLYGIMFADLGQGILLTIIGYLMHKFKKMPIGKILMPCGVSGAFFGLLFGSVFGFEDALNPFYKKLGFASKPIEIMDNATGLLAVSIGIGIILVILAMCLNIYSNIKKKNYGEMLFGSNGVCGILLYCSILAVGVSVAGLITLPTLPIALIGIVLPLILIFLKIPLSNLIMGKGFSIEESIGDYILENFFELFEVILSYLTNTLSFLRVGAFVLIHVGMMTAFFALADIMGAGIPYIIMIIFGNVFVIALEGLLVGIQVLRLEFYEMFSRFYDGDGRIFTSFKFLNK